MAGGSTRQGAAATSPPSFLSVSPFAPPPTPRRRQTHKPPDGPGMNGGSIRETVADAFKAGTDLVCKDVDALVRGAAGLGCLFEGRGWRLLKEGAACRLHRTASAAREAALKPALPCPAESRRPVCRAAQHGGAPRAARPRPHGALQPARRPAVCPPDRRLDCAAPRAAGAALGLPFPSRCTRPSMLGMQPAVHLPCPPAPRRPMP